MASSIGIIRFFMNPTSAIPTSLSIETTELHLYPRREVRILIKSSTGTHGILALVTLMSSLLGMKTFFG